MTTECKNNPGLKGKIFYKGHYWDNIYSRLYKSIASMLNFLKFDSCTVVILETILALVRDQETILTLGYTN